MVKNMHIEQFKAALLEPITDDFLTFLRDEKKQAQLEFDERPGPLTHTRLSKAIRVLEYSLAIRRKQDENKQEQNDG